MNHTKTDTKKTALPLGAPVKDLVATVTGSNVTTSKKIVVPVPPPAPVVLSPLASKLEQFSKIQILVHQRTKVINSLDSLQAACMPKNDDDDEVLIKIGGASYSSASFEFGNTNLVKDTIEYIRSRFVQKLAELDEKISSLTII